MCKKMYDLLTIEPVKDWVGTWSWNAAHYLKRDIELDDNRLWKSEMSTCSYLLKWLRDNEYLRPSDGQGRLTVVRYGEDDYEVQRRYDAKPIFVFQMQREES